MLSYDFKKEEKNTSDLNPAAIGLAGVIAGAVGVTLLALSDEEIRERVNKRAHEAKDNLKKWGTAKIHEHRKMMTKELVEDDLEAPNEVTPLDEKLHN
ncbi:MAG TPA: hypothetical protein VLF93_03415 [Candidatus Saccharimonadales bacterium]|nr:hypothetical protein [Candidatus Saccharimonadales bacterium]